MEVNQYVMALDAGTTSSRCILFDRSGQICSVSQREFEQIYPHPGWVEHNPMDIWSSQIGVAAEAMGKLGVGPENIAAVGITNQRETTIVWDKYTGRPVCKRARVDLNQFIYHRGLKKAVQHTVERI